MISSLDRTFGFYPVSIATSLAIEGIEHTGEYADRTGDPPVIKMEALWINLRTLIRNVLGSFSSEQFNYLNNKEVIESTVSDWHVLKEHFQQIYPHCKLALYMCEYKSLDHDFPQCNFKQAETPKQQLYEALERGVLYHFHENMKEELLVFDWKLQNDRKTVLLTHHPIDLLSYYHFPDLELLESHTGVIKRRPQWNTKLSIDKTVTCIPFNRMMLAIFGDGVMFKPQEIKVRRVLIKLGEKRGWNALTTKSKIIEDIKLEHEPYLLEFVNRYK